MGNVELEPAPLVNSHEHWRQLKCWCLFGLACPVLSSRLPLDKGETYESNGTLDLASGLRGRIYAVSMWLVGLARS